MKKYILLFVVLLLYGCLYGINTEHDNYSHLGSIILPAFSKTITAYYYDMPIPKDFNEMRYIGILNEDKYTDKAYIKLIQRYIIKAHSLDEKYYSVMLCNPKTGNKIMEDINCDLSRTEIKPWEKLESQSCQFEENWAFYCKKPQ